MQSGARFLVRLSGRESGILPDIPAPPRCLRPRSRSPDRWATGWSQRAAFSAGSVLGLPPARGAGHNTSESAGPTRWAHGRFALRSSFDQGMTIAMGVSHMVPFHAESTAVAEKMLSLVYHIGVSRQALSVLGEPCGEDTTHNAKVKWHLRSRKG